MTAEELKSQEISNELTNRGIVNHFSVSNTDFGTSCYFTFYLSESEKYVIRISDHSATNVHRLANESHYDAKVNVQSLCDNVERLHFPERFAFTTECAKATHRINGVFGAFKRV